MRLRILETGHRPAQRGILRIAGLIGLRRLDVVKTFMYRPEYFGIPFCDLAQTVMCRPSQWSRAEREMFGAYVSGLNDCVF
jgi:hypothetical protein